MKKWFACIFLITNVSGCASTQSARDIGKSNPSPNMVTVYLNTVDYRDEQELEKYKRAVKLAEETLNSENFKARVLAGPEQLHYIYPNNPEQETKECNGDPEATYTFNVVGGKCMSNRKILDLIESSDWGMSARINYRWWAIWCGKPFVNEVGHREDITIVTQECQFNRMSDEQLAGHLIHEHLHVLGFDHPYDKSENRKYTVPYFVGNVASELLSK